MADTGKNKSGGGCLGRLLALGLLAAAVVLGLAVFLMSRPQDLADLGGGGQGRARGGARDLHAVLKQSVERGFAVTLTEAEINQWLAKVLVARQGGLLDAQVTIERVWVRLLDGHAEVIMERRVKGRPFTVSMFLTVEQLVGPRGMRTEVHLHGGPYHELVPRPPRGGRFGRLVVPQGFLILIKPSYEKLAAAFDPEIRLIEEMARIRIEKNRLVLDPREPGMEIPGLPQSF